MQKRLTLFLSIAALCGCSATTGPGGAPKDDPVKTADGQYRLGGLGSATDTSGTAVKIRLLQQATAFCSGKGLAMAPGKSTTKDPSAGTRASAGVQFRCIGK